MDETPRRRTVLTVVAGGLAATAGCLGGSTSGGSSTGEDAPYDGWLDNANGFEETADRTGADQTTVSVGADSGYAFDPAAISVTTGTEVRWEWTDLGGGHNVVDEDGAFESEILTGEGETFSHTFEEPGVYKYACTPHRSQGMLGVVEVVDE